MAQFQVHGLAFSQVLNPAIPYTSVRALKFKHIQRHHSANCDVFTVLSTLVEGVNEVSILIKLP